MSKEQIMTDFSDITDDDVYQSWQRHCKSATNPSTLEQWKANIERQVQQYALSVYNTAIYARVGGIHEVAQLWHDSLKGDENAERKLDELWGG